MKKEEAINILTASNKWRRGKIEKMPFSPEVFGKAIDFAISELVNSKKADVRCDRIVFP